MVEAGISGSHGLNLKRNPLDSGVKHWQCAACDGYLRIQFRCAGDRKVPVAVTIPEIFFTAQRFPFHGMKVLSHGTQYHRHKVVLLKGRCRLCRCEVECLEKETTELVDRDTVADCATNYVQCPECGADFLWVS